MNRAPRPRVEPARGFPCASVADRSRSPRVASAGATKGSGSCCRSAPTLGSRPTFRRMKTLHTAYRVTDLPVSLDFYTALGYQEVARVSLSDEATLAMLKFPGEEVATLELVHRPAEGPVQIGTGFSHVVVQVDELGSTIAAISRRGLQPEPEQRPAGPDGPRTSWLTDPHGYRVELEQWPAGHADGISAADSAREPQYARQPSPRRPRHERFSFPTAASVSASQRIAAQRATKRKRGSPGALSPAAGRCSCFRSLRGRSQPASPCSDRQGLRRSCLPCPGHPSALLHFGISECDLVVVTVHLPSSLTRPVGWARVRGHEPCDCRCR
jgi:lactoylglutathione lyase